MEEQAVIHLFEHWHRSGDAQALQEGLRWLERWLPLHPAVVRALGVEAAEDVRAQVIERLLLGKPPPLLMARQPRALALRSLQNGIIDALRRKRRQLDALPPGRAQEVAEHTHGGAAPDVDTLLDQDRQLRWVVSAMSALRLEERAALLLRYAPGRLEEEDWLTIAARHQPPGPLRPEDVLSLQDVAVLLFPDVPERVAYERTGKQLQRALAKLRKALAVPDDASGEDPT